MCVHIICPSVALIAFTDAFLDNDPGRVADEVVATNMTDASPLPWRRYTVGVETIPPMTSVFHNKSPLCASRESTVDTLDPEMITSELFSRAITGLLLLVLVMGCVHRRRPDAVSNACRPPTITAEWQDLSSRLSRICSLSVVFEITITGLEYCVYEPLCTSMDHKNFPLFPLTASKKPDFVMKYRIGEESSEAQPKYIETDVGIGTLAENFHFSALVPDITVLLCLLAPVVKLKSDRVTF